MDGGGAVPFEPHLPVRLLENETLLFDPGPPALGTHPLTRIDHSRREIYEAPEKRAFFKHTEY